MSDEVKSNPELHPDIIPRMHLENAKLRVQPSKTQHKICGDQIYEGVNHCDDDHSS